MNKLLFFLLIPGLLQGMKPNKEPYAKVHPVNQPTGLIEELKSIRLGYDIWINKKDSETLKRLRIEYYKSIDYNSFSYQEYQAWLALCQGKPA